MYFFIKTRLIRLSGIRLSGIRLSGIRLSGIRLSGIRLSGIRLSGIRLSGIRLSGIRLSGIRLSGIRYPSFLPCLSIRYFCSKSNKVTVWNIIQLSYFLSKTTGKFRTSKIITRVLCVSLLRLSFYACFVDMESGVVT